MTVVYPVTEPTASGWLDVGDGNRIWWEEAGNPEGLPAVVLHGGPGSGSSPSTRRFFDPARYRIIQFDQRGCGRSTPNAAGQSVDFSVNTTAHLVGDIEKLRRHLGIDRWLVHANSWGTTLALVYAEQYPDRVRAMVLQGVTTTSQREIDWLYGGVAVQFPEAWAALRALIPADTPDSGILAAYGDLLLDPDPAVHDAAALAFHKWDWVTLFGDPNLPWSARWDDPAYRLARARICTHYFRNGGFLADGQILANAHRLSGIPGILVQGLLDLQAPAQTAESVAGAWSDAELVLVKNAGHSNGDAGMPDALTAALDRFAR